MSSESKDSKTEQPTPYKLKEARRKGQVARSMEVSSALILLFATIYFWANWEWMQEQFELLMLAPLQFTHLDFSNASQGLMIFSFEKAFYQLGLPFSVVILFAAILGNLIQFGVLFSFEPIKPKMEKISPVQGVKRIFSVKQVIKTLFSIFKITVATIIIIILTRMAIEDLIQDLEQCEVLCQKVVMETMVKYLVISLLIFLVIIAMLDVLFQKKQFVKDQRMSKDEVKREHKNREGDPQIKGKRRSEQRDLLNQDVGDRIKKARVLIMGQQHVIALQYDDEMPMPMIVAIGKGEMARKMIDIAKKEDVALVRDPKTAETLQQEGKIDEYIPKESINGVVTALKQVM